MEFRELKTFQVVASLLSFNNAAEILHVAQSTVSAQIRSLENDLGKDLFLRSGKTISLTPAGAKLLTYTQRLVNMEQEIRSILGNIDDQYGTLTIKTPQSLSTLLFPELIKEFQLLFPKMGFDIDWCTSFHLIDLFNSGTIDLAFLITDYFDDKNLRTEELSEVKLILAASPKDPLTKKNNVTVDDLNDTTLIFAKSECNYKNILQKMLLRHNVKPRKMIEINSLDAVKRLLLLENGISFIPESIITEELKTGQLKALNWSGENIHAKLIMIWPQDKHVSDSLSAFMIMTRKTLSGITV